jgi:Bacterial Ig-like domain (group 3)
MLLYQPNQFRASDHDPGLGRPGRAVLAGGVVRQRHGEPDAGPNKKDTSTVTVTVTGGQGVTPTGSVGFWVDGQQVGTVPLAADGTASKVVGPFASACTRTVEVRYSGDMVTRTGTTTM